MTDTIQTKLNTLIEHCKVFDKSGGANVLAGIYQRNKLIAFGLNQNKSHPFQAKFAKNRHAIFLHAETDAIKNVLKFVEVNRMHTCSLYIVRIKWTDTYKTSLVQGLAKPCEGCQRAIATFGISEVYYTLDNEGYDCL